MFALGRWITGGRDQGNMSTYLKFVLLCLYPYHFGALLIKDTAYPRFQTKLLLSVNASAPYGNAPQTYQPCRSDDTQMSERNGRPVKAEITILLGAGLDLVNVGLSWALVGRYKECVDLSFLGEPCSHLAKLFAQARDSLVVHVGLRNEFGHGD